MSGLKLCAVEGFVGRRGNAVALHEGFGKILRTFQLRPLLRRTNDRDVAQVLARSKIVADALHKWVFGANHKHVNALLKRKPSHALKVVGLQTVHIDGHLGRTSVARSHIEGFNQRTLRNLPSQSVLAAAASKE